MSEHAADSDGAPPTLELRQFALRSPTASQAPPLSLRSHARRIALVGDWEPFFQVLGWRAELASGSATILDCPLESAIARGILGFAACDPPLPGSFTVNEYLQHAARLSHGSPSRAAHDAQRALERYGLSELAKRKLAQTRALSTARARDRARHADGAGGRLFGSAAARPRRAVRRLPRAPVRRSRGPQPTHAFDRRARFAEP